MKSKETITIRDIAAAAGVSKTTVSRYINGQINSMSETTRNRIQSIIEMSDYRPNDTARNLKRQNSNLIGIIISDISSPFSSAVIIGIGNYLREYDYTPLFVNCDDSFEQEKKGISSLLAKKVSGLIVNTTSYHNNFLTNIECQGMPVVLCDRYIKDHSFNIVTSRHKEGMLDLIQHLKEQGYTRPVLFTQRWEENSTRTIRRQSFIEAVEQVYGYSPENDVFLICTGDKDSVYNTLSSLMSSLKPGDLPAVVGTNSVTTVHVFKAINKLGLNIPDEIGLCGPEDWDWNSEMNWPTLVMPHITTLVVHSKEIGSRSIKLLLDKIRKPDLPPQEIKLPCELSIRQSTMRRK